MKFLSDMRILSIDPGTTESGYVVWDGEQILDMGKIANFEMLDYIATKNYDTCIIERIACYGMPMGESTIETIFVSGRMYQVAFEADKRIERVLRKDVKMAICGQTRAKDSNIIQALKDRFEPNLELHKKPTGILKGLKKDIWQAFALSVYWYDLNCK